MTKRLNILLLGCGLLLLGAAPAWAVENTWSAAGAAKFDSAQIWSEASVPIATDTVIFDGTGAGACTIDEAAVCNRIVITSGAITMSGSGTLTVGAGGFDGSTGGTFDDGGLAVVVGGPTSIVTAFAPTLTGTWTQSTTSDIVNATVGNTFNTLAISDGTGAVIKSTRTGAVYAKSISIGAGDSLLGAQVLYLRPTANDFIAIAAAGGIAGGATSVYLAANRTQAVITVGDSVTFTASAATDTLKLTGALACVGFTGTTGAFETDDNTVTVSDHFTIAAAYELALTGVVAIDAKTSIANLLAGDAFDTLRITTADTVWIVDSSFVTSEFTVTGTWATTQLIGAGCLLNVPKNAHAYACEISGITAVGHKLQAVGCRPNGELIGVQVRR